MVQLTLFKKSIKDQTIELLKSGWYSTNQMVQKIGAQSADRRLRDIRKEYIIQERTRKDGIIERHIV